MQLGDCKMLKLNPWVVVFTFSGVYLMLLLQAIVKSGGDQPAPEYVFFLGIWGFLAIGL
jgi:hypothetical protein